MADDEFQGEGGPAHRELDEQFLRRHLKLRQLVVLDAVFDERSLTKAADVLRLTQPAVTKVIQSLEATLGVPLLERTPRGVLPTIYGEAVHARIKGILTEVRYLGDELSALGAARGGHVVTGTMISAAAWLVPQAIVLLKQRSPEVVVSVQEGSNVELMPKLLTGELDVVVGRIPSEVHVGVRHEPLYNEQLCAVGRRGHPAATRETLSIEELAAFPWIIPITHGPVRDAIERMFRQADLPLPRNRVHSLSILTNVEMMRATDVVCLLPRVVAQQYLRQQVLTILPLHVTEPLGEVGLSVAAARRPTPATAAFIEALRGAASQRP